MLRILLAIVIIVPALEIAGIITLSHLIGGWVTFMLIVASGLLGVYLAKRVASGVFNYARLQMSQGQAPAASILNGICIFVGGVLLVLPGFITDIIGLLLVIPFTRPMFKLLLLAIIQKQISKRGGTQIFFRK
ncbi:phage T7 F exclusion suppressor FxsA [compost metagenome]